jgi:hypothetical protein
MGRQMRRRAPACKQWRVDARYANPAPIQKGVGVARVSISAVWDRTTEFLGERSGAVLAIAGPAIAGCLFAQQLTQKLLEEQPVANSVVSILLQLPLLWAQLQVMALAIDPAVTPAEAVQRASNRMPATLLLWLVLLAVVAATMIPVGVLLAASGVPIERVAALGPNADPQAVAALIPQGAVPFLLATLFYLGIVAVALLVLFLRWTLIYVVGLVEALALPALRRSWQLTRRMTLPLLGVSLLYGLVTLVATLAAQTVVGTVLALVFGKSDGFGIVAIGAALATACVAAAMTVVAASFIAKFYLAARRAEDLG